MKENLTFEQYQKQSYIAIQPHTDRKDEILNWSIGLSEEVGEVMNHIKHHCWGSEQISEEEIAKELGDVCWYLSALCTVLQINFETVALLNMKKLEHRFGGQFSVEKSQNRHDKEMKFKDTDQYKELIEKLVRRED